MKNSKRYAAIYTRISNDREGAGLGVQRQEQDCRDLAESLGWTVVGVHQDNDLSAYQRKKPRPGYKALLADLKTGTANAVIAWHSDRLHRRTAELETFIDIVESTGAAVATVRGGEVDLSSPDGRMQAKFLGAISQREIEHSRDRMVRAKRQAAEDGKWRGGPRPFGYEADGMTVCELEAEALREAAAAIIAGQSLRSTAKEMAERGIRTTSKKAALMSDIPLRNMLLRPRNAGFLEVRGEIEGKAAWPAIMNEETWRAIVSILKDPARRTTTGNDRKWMGSGLFRCGVCGASVRTTMSEHRIRTYRCNKSGCVSRNQALVDELVLTVIAERLRLPDVGGLLKIEQPDIIEPLRSEANSLRKRSDQLAVDYAEGSLTARQVKLASEHIETRLHEVEEALADQGRASGLGEVLKAQDAGQAFLDSPLGRKRAIIDALAVVEILPQSKGRPKGWKPGQAYFDPATVKIGPKERS